MGPEQDEKWGFQNQVCVHIDILSFKNHNEILKVTVNH